MAISTQLSADGQELTIAIQGRFDFGAHQAFRDAYERVESTPKRYLVDLQGTTYLDSSALGMLLMLRDKAKSSGKTVCLANARGSVRQVLDYVARGEVDAGFVYRTDAKQLADKVDVVMIVEGHDPVSYPIAVVNTGKDAKMGQEFMNFVISPEGQAVLAKYGFSKP